MTIDKTSSYLPPKVNKVEQDNQHKQQVRAYRRRCQMMQARQMRAQCNAMINMFERLSVNKGK